MEPVFRERCNLASLALERSSYVPGQACGAPVRNMAADVALICRYSLESWSRALTATIAALYTTYESATSTLREAFAALF